MGLGFPEIVLTIGVLLVLVSAISGLIRGTVLSVSLIAVAAGALLNELGVTGLQPGDPEIVAVIELALIFTLFSDGQVVERELLLGQKGPTVRALALAMPGTMVLIAVATKLLFSELSWIEALLLGAVLAPTDPVITSAVVAARGIPAKLRHVLNLESGLNDGLALPFVLIFIAVAVGGAGGATREAEEAGKLIGEAVAGAVIGYVIATLGGRAIDDLPGVRITPKYEGIYALGIALVAFGLAESTIGNGFIATFVAGIALAIADRESPDAFQEFNESVGAILQTVTFFVFGVLIVDVGLPAPVLAACALVIWVLFVARPAAIMGSLVGSDLPPLQRRFLGWFGPKGVASMLFALLVLKSGVEHAELLFQLAAFIILASIIAHGATDTIGARWLERRLEAEAEATGETGADPGAGYSSSSSAGGSSSY